MTPVAIRRLGYSVLRSVAPVRAGRLAADTFSDTRPLGVYPDDVSPLGARGFRVDGEPRVRGGYLWGEQGPTVLLVHGWGADSSSMHGLISPLRQRGFRVAAFDAPGHGVSAGSQATMTEFTRATGTVLDTLGGVRAVIAHSLGSIAAVGALAPRPAMPVGCLAFVAPAASLAGVLERWSAGRPEMSRPVVDRIYAELHRRNGVPVSHWDVVGLGRTLDCPKLAIHDPGDPVVPFSDAEAIAAGLRTVRLAVAPGHGHLGILMAARVTAAVSAFVAEHVLPKHVVSAHVPESEASVG